MYGDVNDLHVPLVVAAWRNIMNGDAPFWSAATFAGQNMLGSGQSAIFYPVNVLFGMFKPVTAYRWWLLTHIWVAAAGSSGLVLGVPVPAGRHVVDVRFRPPGLGWGMLLGLLAVSGLAASPTVGVFRRRGGRRRAVSDPIPSADTSTFATGTPAG